MVTSMKNFCEEKYDYENGEFEGWEPYRRDTLRNEGPLGADCHYGGWQSPGEVWFHWEDMGMHFALSFGTISFGFIAFVSKYRSRTPKLL